MSIKLIMKVHPTKRRKTKDCSWNDIIVAGLAVISWLRARESKKTILLFDLIKFFHIVTQLFYFNLVSAGISNSFFHCLELVKSAAARRFFV